MSWYYKLDVKDAVVTVRPWGGAWRYRFTWLDGSHGISDEDWHPNEQGAKAAAKSIYQFKTRNRIKRAKWIMVQDLQAAARTQGERDVAPPPLRCEK